MAHMTLVVLQNSSVITSGPHLRVKLPEELRSIISQRPCITCPPGPGCPVCPALAHLSGQLGRGGVRTYLDPPGQLRGGLHHLQSLASCIQCNVLPSQASSSVS